MMTFTNKSFYLLMILYLFGVGSSISVLYFEEIFYGKSSSFQEVDTSVTKKIAVKTAGADSTDNGVLSQFDSADSTGILDSAKSLFKQISSVASQSTPSILYFQKYPKVVIWLLLYIVLFTYMLVCIPLLWNSIYTMIKRYKLNKKEYILSFFLVALVMLAMLAPTRLFYDQKLIDIVHYPLLNVGNKILLIWTIAYILFFTCLYAMLILMICSDKIDVTKRECIASYLELKSLLQLYLVVIGLLLTIGVLTSAATVNSYIAYYPRGLTVDFARDAPKIYTLYHTIFVAAVYVPVFLKLYFKGKEFKQALNPMPETADDIKKIEEWEDKDVEFNNILRLTGSFKGSIAIAVPLLTPLVSSYVLSILNVNL